jgi:hypothetical protein
MLAFGVWPAARLKTRSSSPATIAPRPLAELDDRAQRVESRQDAALRGRPGAEHVDRAVRRAQGGLEIGLVAFRERRAVAGEHELVDGERARVDPGEPERVVVDREQPAVDVEERRAAGDAGERTCRDHACGQRTILGRAYRRRSCEGASRHSAVDRRTIGAF